MNVAHSQPYRVDIDNTRLLWFHIGYGSWILDIGSWILDLDLKPYF